ncbi:hypothetical protein [Sedimentibacter sp.]|nr:hypothetical protein [Sedimentibacter sp.]
MREIPLYNTFKKVESINKGMDSLLIGILLILIIMEVPIWYRSVPNIKCK